MVMTRVITCCDLQCQLDYPCQAYVALYVIRPLLDGGPVRQHGVLRVHAGRAPVGDQPRVT